LVGHDEESPAAAMRRLPAVDPFPELAELPPVCLSSLPGLKVDELELARPQASGADEYARDLPPIGNPQSAISNLNPHPKASAEWKNVKQELASEYAGLDPHAELFAKDCYPSATACRKCHERIYEEWAISSHANAAVSPMFHKFEQKINALAQGTLGYFCMRCHAPVATTMKHPRWESISEGPKGLSRRRHLRCLPPRHRAICQSQR
jgi:hypothetical protein